MSLGIDIMGDEGRVSIKSAFCVHHSLGLALHNYSSH